MCTDAGRPKYRATIERGGTCASNVGHIHFVTGRKSQDLLNRLTACVTFVGSSNVLVPDGAIKDVRTRGRGPVNSSPLV